VCKIDDREVSVKLPGSDKSDAREGDYSERHTPGEVSRDLEAAKVGDIQVFKQASGNFGGFKIKAGKPSGVVRGAIGGDHNVGDTSLTDRVRN
jgi:hypothetical protein